MRLVVENIKTTAIVGGKDFLLDIDLMKTLKEYLRVRPDGYNFSPMYKKRQWDGWRYFINDRGEFATGFLELILDYMKDLGVDVQIEDNRGNLPIVCRKFDDYVGEIDGVVWGLRDYQIPAVRSVFEKRVGGMPFPRGIIDAATNAGKTSIIAGILNNLETYNSALFIVSSKTIFNQSVDFFSQVIGEPVGNISSGVYETKRFTVAMVKSLYNQAKKSNNVRKYLKEIDVLFVDESDEAGATEYSKVLQWVGAGMRILVSGTPLEASKVNNMIAVGLSGKVLYKITNKEVIDAGYSLVPKITIKRNKNTGNALTYKDELEEEIHTSENRLKLIYDIVEEHSDKQIVITFIEKKHGYFMYENLCNRFSSFRDQIEIAHGTSKDREDIIDRFKKGKTSVLLTSTILKKGANIPNIEVIILAQAGKSVITVKQFLGRGLRTDGKNSELLVYDFYDEGDYVSAHSRQRIRLYKKEGFDVVEDYKTFRGKPVN